MWHLSPSIRGLSRNHPGPCLPEATGPRPGPGLLPPSPHLSRPPPGWSPDAAPSHPSVRCSLGLAQVIRHTGREVGTSPPSWGGCKRMTQSTQYT